MLESICHTPPPPSFTVEGTMAAYTYALAYHRRELHTYAQGDTGVFLHDLQYCNKKSCG